MRQRTRLSSRWNAIDTKARGAHPELWKLVMFTLSGVVSNIPELGMQYLCLYGLRALGVENLGIFGFMEKIVTPMPGFSLATVAYAYMLSTAVGYTIAFIFNRKATFQSNSNVALSTSIYVAMVIFTIFANGTLVGPGIDSLVLRLGLSEALTIGISKLLCMVVPALWMYPMNRFVIHRVTKKPEEETPNE